MDIFKVQNLKFYNFVALQAPSCLTKYMQKSFGSRLNSKISFMYIYYSNLTLKAPRKTASENIVCLSSAEYSCKLFKPVLHTGKQCADQTAPKGAVFRSSLIWVHTVCRKDF